MLAYVLLVLLSGLIAQNSAIRALGGHPNLLSPRSLIDKSRALFAFVAHFPRHRRSHCEQDLSPQIREAARVEGLPPEFLFAIAESESRLRPHVISRAGAMGVMQLMPSTAALLRVRDPFDAGQSIHAGAHYLAQLHRRYRGVWARIAAAYNAGPGRVPTRGRLRLPKETQRYVRRVLRRFLKRAGRQSAGSQVSEPALDRAP